MQLEGTSRRLPIYLVLDISSSMSGTPIESVNIGLREFEAALKSDEHARETAHVSVITFSDQAREVLPLTEVDHFSAPKLSTQAMTNLGAAIRLLGQCIERDFRKKDADHPGDWKPLVFLMTDGQPTDNTWESDIAAFRADSKKRPADILAIACGPNAAIDVLRRITETVLSMPEMTQERFRALFLWISQSAKLASKSASQGVGAAPQTPYPPAPVGFTVLKN